MRVLLLSAILFLISCKSNEATTPVETAPKSISFNQLNAGTNGRFEANEYQVISNEQEFKKVWDLAFANFMDKEPFPSVSFETQLVLLVAMGERNSGGYNISIKSIDETKTNVVVTVEESKPGSTCITTTVMAYPYQIVTIDKSKKEVTFKKTEKVIECEK
ncbi:MAG: protease complex subunit PrcB family protein [Flavobacteriales bacterium]|nr:protease complex subunit PrcB family protein [Flavobacteriales bacterium]